MTTVYCNKCGGYIYTDDYCTAININSCICTDEPIVTQPQKQPFRCPVCGGNGLVPDGFYNITTGQWTAPTYVLSINCRSCNGTGIV